MGNSIRFVGLSSGLDTQSVVDSLLKPYQSKIDKIKGKTTVGEWKKDAYKEMSLKLTNFRTKTVNTLKSYNLSNKLNIQTSQQGIINIDSKQNAPQGSFKIKVDQIAEAAIAKTETIKAEDGSKLTKDSLVKDIKDMPETGTLKINNVEISFDATTTISQLEAKVNEKLSAAAATATAAGDTATAAKLDISFKFDESAGAFLVNSSTTGADKSISFEGSSAGVLSAMGISANEDGAYTFAGKDAEVMYNGGVKITSSTNDIEVNGVKFTALQATPNEVTVSIEKDIDSIIDTVKSFIKEYNSLLEEMNTKLDADSASNYEPLTDEEKDAMTDKEIEAWENKIKSAIFRKDSSMSEIVSMFRSTASGSYKGEDGISDDCCMLSQLGIGSNNWSEKGKLSIKDEQQFRTALSNNFDGVINLIDKIADKLDSELYARSKSTDNRSYGQFFNDKLVTSNLSQYANDLISAQAKYDKMETYYYKKFTAMETAMNQSSSQSSLFSSL